MVSREGRSRIMRSIRAKNTKPEIRVRQWLHRNGFRFRLHEHQLPGAQTERFITTQNTSAHISADCKPNTLVSVLQRTSKPYSSPRRQLTFISMWSFGRQNGQHETIR